MPAKFSKDLSTHTLVLEKLASSGLTPETGIKMGVRGLTGKETQALYQNFLPLRSLYLPYYGVKGEPLSDWPNCPPFFRLRYLEEVNDFSKITEGHNPRYVQLPNTAPVAYFPKNQDWSGIYADVDQPLIITEGELKAAKACQEGFPTIGIGGVHSWKALKLGLEWLPSMECIAWIRRNVYICYDSDLRTNPNVTHALWGLATALHRQGALVSLVSLPSDAKQKVGLDDFLLQPGSQEQFRGLLKEAEPLGLTRILFNYNARYVYVRNPGLVIDETSDTKIAPAPFKDHVESVKRYQERKLNQDGSISYKMVSATEAWLHWPLRHYADQLTYQPGSPREFTVGELRHYNIWTGWGVKPRPGNVKPFLDLVDHIFLDAEQGAKEWFLKWCAYPLKYPGVKLFTSCVIHGRNHGTGKSLLGYTIGRIYGKNFVEISQGDLHGNFNEWAEAKQFVLGDDVTGSNKRQEGDVLKKLITQRELRVNAKYMPSYVVPDCINYYFTSNHPDAFFLEDDDRRFFIHEVTKTPLPELFYAEYDLWLDTGGSAAVFGYLLALDVGDFNPAATAFKTMAKDRMIADGQSDLGAWVRTLQATPDFILRIGDIPMTRDLYTSKELLQLYDPSGKTGTTANGLGRELRRAGVLQIMGGKPIRLPDGSQGRYYIARKPEVWSVAQWGAMIKHLTQPSLPVNTPKY